MNAPLASFSGRFQISEHDRITIGGKAMRLAYKTHDGYVLMDADGKGVSETFSYSALSRLNASKQIKHEPDFYLPDQARRRLTAPATRVSDLKPNQRDRLRVRHAYVQAFDEMKAEGLIAENDASIMANMTEVCERGLNYMNDHAPHPDEILRDIDIKQGRRAKLRGGVKVSGLRPVHPRTLRKWLKLKRELGLTGLADNISNRGNRNSYHSSEERAVLMKTVRKSYLSLNRPTKANTTEDVNTAFHDENIEREKQGLSALRRPSREAVRKAINSLDRYTVVLARFGPQAAVKLFKPVGQGLDVDRPFQRVEMDEWKIDLITMMSDAGLLSFFTKVELAYLGLDNKKARWWVAVAIDCRTRCIVGMKLTRNPKTCAALECLRMTTIDKGVWADAVGAVSGWGMAATPEMVVVDNGKAFQAFDFSNACADLWAVLEYSIAGIPGMRGTIESLFRTALLSLLHRLNGRTFSSALERGDHPSEDRATLTAEDLCFALVRWVVDIYHNTPHSGLGGRTPLEQWDADHEEGNYPMRACPSEREDRLAFGVHLKRRVDKYGIQVLGVRYHSQELATFYNSGGKRDLEVRWLPNNIGAIEVRLDGEWHEMRAVHDGFDGLHSQIWLEARRSLKTSDPAKLKWREDVVCKAINAIRDMNTQRSLEFNLIAQNWDPERVEQAQKSMFVGFNISKPSAPSEPTPNQYGQTLVPAERDEYEAPEIALPPIQNIETPKKSWAIKKGDE